MDEKLLSKTLGKAVRARRKNAGLTIGRLAEMVDVDAGFMTHIELGMRMPSLPTAARIAEALDISLAELFKAVPKTPPKAEEQLVSHLRHLLLTRNPTQREALIAILKQLGDPDRVDALRRLLRR
ncbi:MAG: helix-turn-helix transcriptional regulator [Elusimicrobiota bacterium]|nr:helix-turn-helix transcriptional regulator [Elusimicrobiota bacterium]